MRDVPRLVTMFKSVTNPLAMATSGCRSAGRFIGYEDLGDQKLTTMHVKATIGADIESDAWYWEEAGCVLVQHLDKYKESDHRAGVRFLSLENGYAAPSSFEVPDYCEEVNFSEPERRMQPRGDDKSGGRGIPATLARRPR